MNDTSIDDKNLMIQLSPHNNNYIIRGNTVIKNSTAVCISACCMGSVEKTLSYPVVQNN